MASKIEPEKYRFREWSPKYEAIFRREKREIGKALGGETIIEHVGSTAVHGLGGKGIVDIAVAVPRGRRRIALARLKKLGFDYVSSAGDNDRRFLQKILPEERVHVHLTYPNSLPWRSHIAMRDYLNGNVGARNEYSKIKARAARLAKGEGKRYRALKKPFLDRLERKALASSGDLMADRTFMDEVVKRLKRRYRKEMKTSLEHTNPWELLVATMLSAQSQDSQVNKATARLFKAYRTPSDFARLRPSQLYSYIGMLGLYRGKSKNIIATARILERDFHGMVPRTMDDMVKLPGVGRKTANVVLGNAFHVHEGIAIDTHCITVANRLGIARTGDPALIEKKVMRLVDRKEYANVSHLFIALGRDACTARAKHCGRCVLKDICPSSTER